jgi:hypothetical protein
MATPYGAFAGVDETFGVGRQFEAREGFAGIRPLLRNIDVVSDSNGNGASVELVTGVPVAHEAPLATVSAEPRAATAYLVGDSVSVVAYGA